MADEAAPGGFAGNVPELCVLYIYELLNQIGVADPMDGYRKLTEFRDAYGALDDGILPYLNQWLMDYVVYYNLDAGLLADNPRVRFNRSIAVLDSIRSRGDEEVIRVVKQLSPKWLERSKFYREYREDCDTVIVRVLRRMAEHYDARCKKTMVEQYVGSFTQSQVILFDSAVFTGVRSRAAASIRWTKNISTAAITACGAFRSTAAFPIPTGSWGMF